MKQVWIVVAVLLVASGARAAEPSAEAKAVVQTYVTAFSKGDVKAALPVVAGDAAKTLAFNFARSATGTMKLKDKPEFADAVAHEDTTLVQTTLEAARKIDPDFQKVKFLFVLKKVEGKLRIVHIKPQNWDAPAKESYESATLPDEVTVLKEMEEMKAMLVRINK